MIRTPDDSTYAITDDIATTATIPFQHLAGGMIHVPAGSPLTTLTWYTSHEEEDDSYLPAYDGSLTAPAPLVQTVIAPGSFRIPIELYGATHLRAVGNADGALHISLKS